mmetsp:Transcript_8941/g.29394  ORF Transcript_8941/g.29394 Transcript_8941/m.29394 type:complete len:257 (-) Transcript_8941:1175-1945(-)
MSETVWSFSWSMRSAHSVRLPTKLMRPSSSGTRNALLLSAMPRARQSTTGAESVGGIEVSFLPANHPSTTVMRFSVRVPVLSLQICVAPPIVSHAAKKRTRLLSLIIFFMEYANEMVTASGSPSGTATTTMVTASKKKWSTSFHGATSDGKPLFFAIHAPVSEMKQHRATANPTYPILLARSPSFSCSGVSSCSLTTSASVWPHSECSPTATMRTTPDPSVTCVPERQNCSDSPFLIGSDSPVSDASSTTMSKPRT